MNVVIYTRTGCPLCDTAITMARSVFGTNKVMLVDIDLDLGLLGSYTDRVPVIETEGGDVIDEGIVTEENLRASLAE